MHGQFFSSLNTVAKVKAFHICTYHTTATVIVGRKIVSQKNHVRWISIATSNCGWLEHDACSKRVLRVWYSPHLLHFFCCTRIAFEASATRSHHMHAADCGAKQIFLTFLIRAKQSLKRSAKCKHPLLWAGKTHGRALFVPGSLLSGLGYCWAWPF